MKPFGFFVWLYILQRPAYIWKASQYFPVIRSFREQSEKDECSIFSQRSRIETLTKHLSQRVRFLSRGYENLPAQNKNSFYKKPN